MKLEKKHKIAIGITSGLILLSVTGLIYSWKKKILFWKEEAEFIPDAEAEKKANEVAKTTGRPKITWRDDSFPLSIGSKGQNVKNLQNYLGIDDDGYFGYGTHDALKKKTGRDKVASESEYTTTTNTASQPFQKGRKVYAKNTKTFIFYKPDKDFLLGYVKPFDTVGYYDSPSTINGWSKVSMTGYYNEEGTFITKRDVYFVPTGFLTDKKA